MDIPETSALSGHLIICGLGHVGNRILNLASSLGEQSVVITLETSEAWLAGVGGKVPLIFGDARNPELLARAGIERAKAILIVTNDDLANVSIALDARRVNPDLSVVVRIFDQELAAHLDDMWARGCAQYKGHIIVTGLGNIGFRVVRELARNGETVVAVEEQQSGNFIQAARELVPVVIGNARTEETLRRAGIAGAKAIIAVTDDDVVNLSTGLRTKRAHPGCRTVLRIFDSHLAEKLQRNLEVDAVLCTSSAAAPTFLGAVLCPGL